jgi:hypothetical protein
MQLTRFGTVYYVQPPFIFCRAIFMNISNQKINSFVSFMLNNPRCTAPDTCLAWNSVLEIRIAEPEPQGASFWRSCSGSFAFGYATIVFNLAKELPKGKQHSAFVLPPAFLQHRIFKCFICYLRLYSMWGLGWNKSIYLSNWDILVNFPFGFTPSLIW